MFEHLVCVLLCITAKDIVSSYRYINENELKCEMNPKSLDVLNCDSGGFCIGSDETSVFCMLHEFRR